MQGRNQLTEPLARLRQGDAFRADAFCQPGLHDFASNDYLGLAQDPVWQRSLYEAIGSYLEAQGPSAVLSGSTGSRLVSGCHQVIREVEQRLCDLTGAEAALIFSSGYQANLGLLGHLQPVAESALYDQNCHASLQHGLKDSQLTCYPFRHNDLDHLEKRLARLGAKGAIVVVESLYSMDGDQAPLHGLLALCERYGAQLIVDEAHTFGWSDPFAKKLTAKKLPCAEGSNLLGEKSHWPESLFARVVAFGKGLASSGAAVLGSRELIDWLKNSSHPAIYSTAPSPLTLLPVLQALREIGSNAWAQRVFLLHERIEQYVQRMRDGSLSQASRNHSPIQFALIPGNSQVLAAERYFAERGFFLKAIRSPTVMRGKERLRISLHANHSLQALAELMQALQGILV